jgi:hypothetical protein
MDFVGYRDGVLLFDGGRKGLQKLLEQTRRFLYPEG